MIKTSAKSDWCLFFCHDKSLSVVYISKGENILYGGRDREKKSIDNSSCFGNVSLGMQFYKEKEDKCRRYKFGRVY